MVKKVQNGAPVTISIVSFWEFLLKAAYHDIGITFDQLQKAVTSLKSRLLPIAIPHLETLRILPFVNGHKDPFDRLIIAQAISEGLLLVGSDLQFPKYTKSAAGRDLTIYWA